MLAPGDGQLRRLWLDARMIVYLEGNYAEAEAAVLNINTDIFLVQREDALHLYWCSTTVPEVE
ncbi:hypothetical protein E2C01_003287 [Portunus trituberculatus]|uniref:Uncharacterized protein n=1 Tax=Portunus trituberculatus TaxID=210409 RepID=A0A5B7CNH7_PORTR|nr:hypothetical protein [Portunus trituberculatus]